MKAAVRYEKGPPSVLRYEEIPTPTPGQTEVLVRVEAISVEGGDVLNRRLVAPTTTPHVLGYQAAGTVAAIGRDVTAVRIGQRVVAFNWSGSHGEFFCLPEHFAYPVPDRMNIETAATVPVTFGTADDALFEFGHLQAGETVLIRGATGGVGIAAIQLAKAAGAVVIVTTSSDAHCDTLAGLGADEIINYRAHDLAGEVLRLTQSRGVDLLVDMAGGSYFSRLATTLRYRGRVSVVGAASGERSTLGFMDIVARSLTVSGVLFGREMHLRRTHEIIGRHLQGVCNSTLRMPIARTFALREAAAAHAFVEQSHPLGRVLIIP